MSAERLAQLIRDNQPCVVLTGAGVSTESGIPDFRSPSGIWARYDPRDYATIEAFLRDPLKVWDFYRRRIDVLENARPNAAHDALAAHERDGLVQAIVTQNVDRLRDLAGSSDVVEVHGSIRSSSCLPCRMSFGFDLVAGMLATAAAPTCPGCGSIRKPDVVMFGELWSRHGTFAKDTGEGRHLAARGCRRGGAAPDRRPARRQVDAEGDERRPQPARRRRVEAAEARPARAPRQRDREAARLARQAEADDDATPHHGEEDDHSRQAAGELSRS